MVHPIVLLAAAIATALIQPIAARECTIAPCGSVRNWSDADMYAWTFDDDGDHLCDVWNYGGGPDANMVRGVPCKMHVVPKNKMLGGPTKVGVVPEDFIDIDGFSFNATMLLPKPSPLIVYDLLVGWWSPERRTEAPDVQSVTAIRDDEMAICNWGRPVICDVFFSDILL